MHKPPASTVFVPQTSPSGSLVSRSWICGPDVLESRSLSYGPLPQSFVRCGLPSSLWRVLSSPSPDLICRGEIYLFCVSFFVLLGFVEVFLAQEINRSVRSAFKSSWLVGCLNVMRSDYHLVAQICVLGGRSKEVLFSVWSRSPDMFDQRSRSVLQDIKGLLSFEVGFSVFFTPGWGTYLADLIAAIAYKIVCPLGWVFQPTLSCSSLLTLDIEEADFVYDSTSILIYLMYGVRLILYPVYFVVFVLAVFLSLL